MQLGRQSACKPGAPEAVGEHTCMQGGRHSACTEGRTSHAMRKRSECNEAELTGERRGEERQESHEGVQAAEVGPIRSPRRARMERHLSASRARASVRGHGARGSAR